MKIEAAILLILFGWSSISYAAEKAESLPKGNPKTGKIGTTESVLANQPKNSPNDEKEGKIQNAGATGFQQGNRTDNFLRNTVEESYVFSDVPLRIRGPAMQRFLLKKALDVYGEGIHRYAGYEKTARAQFITGEIYKAQEEIEKALEAYEAVADSPNTTDWSDDARHRIALIHYEKGNYYKAVENAFLLIDSFQRSELISEAYLIAAESYCKTGDYSKAINNYKKMLEAFGNNSDTLKASLGLGDAYMAAGKYDDAQDIYNKVIREYPNSKEYDHAEFMLAKALGKKGNGAAARRILRSIMNSHITNQYIDDAAYEEGHTYYAEGKYAQAIQSYVAASLKYPSYSGRIEALEYTANSYRMMFLYREALLKYGELAETYEAMDTSDYTDTQKENHLRRIGSVFLIMGEINRERGEPEQALSNYLEAKKYIKDEEKLIALEYSLAECYFDIGWFREALDTYKSYIALNPDSPMMLNALEHMAKCNERTGYLLNAQEEYLKVIHTEPEKNTEESERLKSEAVFNVGELYAEQGMLREEAEFYESLLQEHPDFLDEARLLFRLGMVYESTGNTSRAASVYQRILDNYSQSSWYELARLNLEIIKINQKSKRNN